MHEAFWNGLLDVRWEEAPLGTPAKTSSNGSKTSEAPKVMLGSGSQRSCLSLLAPDSQTP